MSLDGNKAIARRWVEEIWYKGNLNIVDELLAPNFVFNYAPPETVPDREAYKQAMNMYRDACPNMYYDIKDMVAEDDKVAVRWIGKGTQKGEIMGIAPTGKEMTVTGISIIRIIGGKIAEEWTFFNLLDYYQQLGMEMKPKEDEK